MPVLADVLRDGLDVVFCGTAAGDRSARLGQYYAHSSNKFWGVLADAGFVQRRLRPSEFRMVLDYGIGLTDLNKEQSGRDDDLTSDAYDVGGLVEKVREYQPRVLAFTSKRAARVFYDRKKVMWGRQPSPVGNTVVWVLPSTSGAAQPHWRRLKHLWYELGEFLRGGEEELR